MNILYYSCHAVLEHDEIAILHSLGHNVCGLGTARYKLQSDYYRPARSLNAAELAFYADYDRRHGRYDAPADSDDFIPDGFADQFDAVIVMHQFHIIQQNWEKFAGRPVIWRTIGQDIDNHERYLAPFRARGMKIVRYSLAELASPSSIGYDAVIRFGKNPDFYHGWNGCDPRILSFVNGLAERYPAEAADFRKIAARVPCTLGGASNESFSEWVGFKTSEEQADLFRTCGSYLYASGYNIPYTLNFVEAWMTGIPIIVFAPSERLGYFEIDKLVEDGVSGCICRTIEQTIDTLSQMIADKEKAARIGNAGREKAKTIFGTTTITAQWELFLNEQVGTSNAKTD